METSHLTSFALVFMLVSLAQAGESEEARRKTIQQKLDSEETQTEFIETPLSDVTAFLGDLHNMTIVLDRPALDDAGIGTDAPVTCNLRLVSLRSALNLVLGELDMQYVVRDGYLLLTTRQVADQMREQRVYPVRDLITTKTEAGAVLQDAEPLLELVEALSPQDQESDSGRMLGSALVATLPAQKHERLAAILFNMRKYRELKAEAPVTAGLLWTLRTPGVAKTIAALDQLTQMEFIETPLQDVMNFISDLHDIPIRLDMKSLDDVGVAADSPVTLNLQDVTLRAALDLLLRDVDTTLTWTIADEVLLITTSESAAQPDQDVLFPVHDLISGRDASMDDLLGMIEDTVDPGSWNDEQGRRGRLIPIPALNMIVSINGLPTQNKLAELLNRLRTAQKEELPQAVKPDEGAGEALVMRMYPLGAPHPDTQQAAEEVSDAVLYFVRPESWKQPGPSIRALPGVLIVRQTTAVQRELERFLDQLTETIQDGRTQEAEED